MPFCCYLSSPVGRPSAKMNYFAITIYSITFPNYYFLYLFAEAHRALELLEDYHSRLSAPQDRALRIAIERVIRIFKSRLFQALLGK